MVVLWWIVVGLIAGWATGKIMKGSGYGAMADILLGIAGALLGGWIMRALGGTGEGGTIYTIVVAIIGAVVLTLIFRAITGRGKSSGTGSGGLRRYSARPPAVPACPFPARGGLSRSGAAALRSVRPE